MRKILALFAFLGLLTCAVQSANAVVVIGGSTNNGNLDLTQATEIVPGFFLPKPQVWQNVGTRTISGPYEDEMSSEPWAGPAPTPVTTDGNLNPPSPEGCGGPDCAVFFKAFSGNATNGAATGLLYQDNPATPGLTYVLTGWAGAEANLLVQDATFSVRFLNGANADIGGATLSLLPALFVPNGQPFNYKAYTVSAVAPAGAVTVRAGASMIGGLSNPAGGGQAFVIDDFTLDAVPEPTALALGLIGLASFCSLTRRR
jgi:PEP-CTERM motif-containing protein